MCSQADLSPALLASESDGLLVFRFRAAVEADGPRHAISTRLGGRSVRRLASCNMSFLAEEPATVTLANRTAFARAAGIPLEHWVAAQQVHGSAVARVGAADRGRGARDTHTRLPGIDALITTEPGVALTVRGADCGLVLLWAPSQPALGVAHAGWQGLAAGVLTSTVRALCHAATLGPGELWACVSPAIGACCYQVGSEVREALARGPGGLERAFAERTGNLWLDVERACTLQLLSAGLVEAHVARAGVCTACHREVFYSARADGEPTGRFVLVAMWA